MNKYEELTELEVLRAEVAQLVSELSKYSDVPLCDRLGDRISELEFQNQALRTEIEMMREALEMSTGTYSDPMIERERAQKVRRALARTSDSFAREAEFQRKLEEVIRIHAGGWMSACLSDELACNEIKRDYRKVFDVLDELEKIRNNNKGE